ncbi:MAG: riboflavin synthase [Dehalococcoidales bacterium]|nr:riboflavin synthase [Dehalococcoidales bacterium]
MFTGIVEEVGRVVTVRADGLVVAASRALGGMECGGSIAVNGVCLTLTDLNSNSFSVGLMPETLRRTNLGRLVAGDKVNLERPLTLGAWVGGHLVQGHVDGTGRVGSITRQGGAVLVSFETSRELMRYVVEKGFVAVDGVSLTVTGRDADSFQVSLVGFTREHTILGNRRVGDVVNLEADIIGKYVERFSRPVPSAITADLLREHGFLT